MTPKPVMIVKDHFDSQVKTNIIIMSKFEILQKNQSVTQRHEEIKCCWQNDADRLAQCRVATKTSIFKKHNICETQ